MSYRTVKRVLGESNLQRKCLRLFFISMLVLITGSFYVASVQNDKIVLEQNRYVAEVVASNALLEAHWEAFNSYDDQLPQEIAELRQYMPLVRQSFASDTRRRDYQWEAIYPRNDEHYQQPRDEFEWQLVDKWQAMVKDVRTEDQLAAWRAEHRDELWAQRPMVRHESEDDEGAIGGARYQYYEPVFVANIKCAVCHKSVTKYRFDMLETGQLMAVLRVDMDVDDTLEAQNGARALLITLGCVTAGLALGALYLIIRYVIVKPLNHLRDVSDAVRRGDVEQRADIHTGDEFEELGAAFNRMLRQLLRQQDELKDVNDELDGKIDELAQVNMRLFELNKVKSDFLATVSHELRTPLNSILGFSELLAKAQALDDKQRRFAGNIERSGRQLLEMINDILDLAKIESGRMEVRPSVFDVGVVVMTQCDLARPLSEKKRIDINCEIAPEMRPIRQDQGKIEQILNNLLSNAIKFTPDGGRIHVTARRDRRGDLRITVADTGVGIGESEQVVVFEKFRQGSNAMGRGNAMTREYSGTGLGLSIVRELCRLLGGDVTLESEVGKGSEFTVILPWELPEHTRMESPLADELRQLANASSEAPLTPARASAGSGF